MAGLILHVLAGLFLVALLQLRGMDWRVQSAGFLGNLVPDIISFGAASLYYGTLDLSFLGRTPILQRVAAYSHGEFAFVFLAVFAVAVLLLYDAHVLRKRLFKEYEEIDVAVGLGILIHIVMDIFIVEQSALI